MPRAQDATTWTPQLKRKNPAAEGPVIWTREERRDGSRPVEAPPSNGDVLFPMQEINLNRSGSGTPDPTFDPATDITYLGAFRIPHFGNDITSTRDKTAIGFKPPEVDGRNGPHGSLFFGGAGFRETFEGVEYPIAGLAEVEIPELSTSEVYTELPATPVLQNFVNIYRRAPKAGQLMQGSASNSIGAIIIEGNKAYISMYESYAASGSNPDNLLICNDCRDMDGSSYQGFLYKEQNDTGAIYSMEIPPEHQSTFGATHFNGIFATISIIGRSSFGPALVSWTPSDITPEQEVVGDVLWTRYTSVNSFERFDYEADLVQAHYEGALGISDMQNYLNSDPATRPTTFENLPLPSPELYGVGGNHNVRVRCSFIPPGSNTVMFIGEATGLRYGLGYKGRSVEDGNTASEAPGFYPFSKYDYANFYWTVNLNDVANAVNPYDPGFIQTGTFDDNRWVDVRSTYRKTGMIVGGVFDSATSRLYVVQRNFIFNNFNDQYVVSAYQVGGGA